MNLKQIKEVWDIYPYEGGYLLFSKENGSGNRMVCKYFCQIFGSNGYFHVSDKPKTKDIAILKTQVDEYVKSLPYDSEYYFPMYNKGIFVYHIIYDYLDGIGFDKGGGWKCVESFELNRKDLYGKNSKDCHLSFSGLRTIKPDNMVTIFLWTGRYSWIETSCEREVEAIKKSIDGLLKPLFLTDSLSKLESAEQLSDAAIDILQKKLSGMNILEQKMNLKQKLQTLIDAI